MKNLHLDLVRVTETGAISAAGWVGRGNKEEADRSATEAMRERLNSIDFLAEIAIGEGKKDGSFGLYEGELVGLGQVAQSEPLYSIAVDPIEGTTPTAKGGYEAMSVIALGTYGAFLKSTTFYMNKFAVGPKITKANPNIGIHTPLSSTIAAISEILEKPVQHITVCLLDRPRHNYIVSKIRAMGCRIKFISDCDVTACIATCVPDSGIDLYIGIGGTPEAVISAAAMKCMGGKFEAQEFDADRGVTDDTILGIEDLAKGPVIFSATGITDGQLLRGVRFTSAGIITNSITMRSDSGTIRKITTEHGN